jgi:putative ABC transport system ATP-binding protein
MASPITPFRRLRALLSLERNDLVVAVVYSVAIGLLSLALPVATQSIVNTIALGSLLQPLAVLTLLVLAGLMLSGVLQGLRVWVVELLQRRVFVRVSSDTVNRLLRAKTEAFEDHHGPELVNRFFDVVTLQKSGATLLLDGLGVALQTIIGMLLLAFYHPWLLAFDALLLAAILLIVFPLGAGAVQTSVAESRAKYALAGWLQEIARHNTTFKSPAAAQMALARASELTGDYLGHRSSHFRILFRQILGTFGVAALASATLLGAGGWLVMQRELTLGQLVAAELVVGMILSGFSKLGKHLELYYDLAAALDKLGYLQDMPLERSGAGRVLASSAPAGLRIRNVWFGYEGKPALLEGAGWEVKPGARVALDGALGCGKSTVLNLLYGLREPSLGSIQIDGWELGEVAREEWRRDVALVRGIEIFEGTVEDNVSFRRSGIGAEAVREALAKVGLLEDVLALPGGIGAELLTGGLPLSTGQSVRLMLARAIVSRPRVLLIDGGLDLLAAAPGFDAVLDILFDRANPWTMITASSNPGILERCDEVYLAEGGALVKAK